MIEGHSAVTQALLGTLFTWGLTAAGSALVFAFRGTQRKILDGSLGFAAGVMTAASFWSLLAPALDMASESGKWGADGEWSFVPASIGFFLGAVFVTAADRFMEISGVQEPPAIALAVEAESARKYIKKRKISGREEDTFIKIETDTYDKLRQRRGPDRLEGNAGGYDSESTSESVQRWRRILLLIIAITVHNIPEGLAVGVGFGAIGTTKSATFQNARNLAIGIGLQNFPEGLAVSVPLRAAGFSKWKSFWWGQLSGVVEPMAGILGAALVSLAEPLLPYALSFAAGAMIYVVVDDIIPEAQQSGNGRLASWGTIIGFLMMMCLDVGLG